MPAEAGIVRVPATTMEEFDTEAFCKVGMLPGEASLVAQSLVHADLTGVFTHGSNFLPLYTNWIQVGSIDPTATPEVVSDNGATAIISARNAMGQVAGVLAMDLAIEKATVRHRRGGRAREQPLRRGGLLHHAGPRPRRHRLLFNERHSGNGALWRGHAQLK